MEDFMQKYIDAVSASLDGDSASGSITTYPSKASFDVVGRIMTSQAEIMTTIGEAFQADLAISPVVIASSAGFGTLTGLKAIGSSLGMDVLDIRCAMMQPHEYMPLHVVGSDEPLRPRYEIPGVIGNPSKPALVILNEALTFGSATPVGLMRQIAEDAAGPVVVALIVSLDQADAALDAVAEALGIHRALVPVAELESDPAKASPPRRVRLVGTLASSGSRSGERYIEIVSSEMPQTTHFILYAKDGQDDDDINDAIRPLLSSTTDVAVTLRLVDQELRCTTDDLTAL